MICLSLIYLLQEGAGNIGDGHSGDIVELNHDMLVAMDALDDALHPCEVALDDADTASLLLQEVVGLKKEDAIVLDSGHPHEVLHLAVGHLEDAMATVGHVIGHVAQGLQLATGHLELGDEFLGGVNKDEVGYGGDELALGLAVPVADEADTHWEEILNLQSVEILLDLLFATVGDTHGKPAKGGGHHAVCHGVPYGRMYRLKVHLLR